MYKITIFTLHLLMKHINSVTFRLAFVSFLINTASGMVISGLSQMPFENSAILMLSRTVGDAIGFITKIFVGFFTDYSKKRKIFLMLGYGLMLIVKPMFAVCMIKGLNVNLAINIFIVANLTDKFLNLFRDIARDTLIVDVIYREHEKKQEMILQQNLAYRKFLSYGGNLLGALITWGYLQFSSNVLLLFWLSVIPCLIAVIFLFLKVHDVPTVEIKKVDKKIEEKNVFSQDLPNINQIILIFLILLSYVLLTFGKINEFGLWRYMNDFGLDKKHNAALYFMYYFVSMVSSLTIARGNFSKTKPFIFSVLCLIISNLICLFSKNIFILIFANLFLAINTGIAENILIPFLLQVWPTAKWKGTLIGFSNGILGGTYLILALFNGFIVKNFGMKFLYSISFIPLSLSILIAIFSYIKIKSFQKKI